jgi:L-asparaginase II
VSTPVVVARLVRSGVVESEHLGSVVVADATGAVVAAVGDPDRPTFVRSAAKPFQAASSLRLVDEILPDEEVAVMAASHNAEEVHLRAVRALLERGGMREADRTVTRRPAWSARWVARPIWSPGADGSARS